MITSIILPWLLFGLKSVPQIFERLFPFHRGLLHSYWASNIYTFYILSDRILIKLNAKLEFFETKNITGGTSGIVTSDSFSILPNIGPEICMLLITLFSFYPLIKLYQQKIKPIPCAVIIMFNVFMLAYHVHEKAIMNVIILMFCNVNFKEKGLRDVITFNGYASFLPLWLGGENRLFR